MKPFSRLLAVSVFIAFATLGRADVSLAPLFTDHAVLQRDKPVPVWGRADAGEKVVVTFRDQAVRTTAGSDGRWIVFLDALPASTVPAELSVAGKNTLTVSDVLVGEVWLCSGQSNMEFTVEARPGTWQANTRATNAPAEVATANFPLIRHVRIEQTVAESPADTVRTGGWQPATPQTAGGFTAVGYFFARDIFQKLGVPVGIVHSSWGGTPVESWMSPATLASRPEFAAIDAQWRQNVAAYPAAKAAYDAALAAWTKAAATARAEATAAGAKTKPKTDGAKQYSAWLQKNPRPRAPRGPGDPWTPTGLFNGMINPLLPYALRGALWYQGESNADRAAEYHARFAAMITLWRAHFGQGDFPFYWVNLANYKNGGDATGMNYAFLREAQTQTLSLPNTGQALAIDIGNPDDIHPANKQDVGRRLALLAKNRTYAVTVDDTGPTFASVTREGPALRVRFTHASGLIAFGKPVQSVEVAGADRVFRPATAKIDRDTLLVVSPEVKEPVAVRYAWKNAPEANLYNGAGLPAVPFRAELR
ncbi:MAG: sialate O-acetylesterase [Verrucomicrobia bacterium]|nr:sialate O-acetylesterase [Verrucomicrobiota bacterium]